MMAKVAQSPSVAEQLAAFFRRNGYVRRQNADRLDREGYWRYKKGDEVRLVAESLLRQAGFKVVRPFIKARQWRQVARFLAFVGSVGHRRTKRCT